MDLSFLREKGLPNLTHLTVIEGDNYNIDHIEHFHSGDVPDNNITKAESMPQTQETACRVSPRNAAAQHISAPMPKEFQTAEAKRVLDKLVVAGLLTEDYMPGCIKESRTGIVRVIKYREKAILAESISKEIWKENRWIIFEDYWKIDNMRSVFGRAMNMKAYGDIIHAINEALK